MSYTKTTWATGDTITAIKLNNIENGIEALDTGSAEPFVFHMVYSENTQVGLSDKTFGEIRQAFNSGRLVYLSQGEEGGNYRLNLMLGYYIYFDYGGAEVNVMGNELLAATSGEAPSTLEELDALYLCYAE